MTRFQDLVTEFYTARIRRLVNDYYRARSAHVLGIRALGLRSVALRCSAELRRNARPLRRALVGTGGQAAIGSQLVQLRSMAYHQLGSTQ